MAVSRREHLSFGNFILPDELKTVINAYNNESEQTSIIKIFYLHKIHSLSRKLIGERNQAVIEWHLSHGNSGLEQHLQRFGVHRDSPDLLLSIEFAAAVYAVKAETVGESKHFYESLQDRDKSLFNENNILNDPIEEYRKNNLIIWNLYSKDQTLQAQILRQREILSLIYAKIEAIQGVVTQAFKGYTTKRMGEGEPSNNQNFYFNINDERLVIRVEDRDSLSTERQLQVHEVSKYFIEEYATLMQPFGQTDRKEYHPVVFSQLANQGDLERYAKDIFASNVDEETKLDKTVEVFKQVADFCLKLKESGHYHPDIKLTNFLMHDDQLKISDRKTIINKEHTKANAVFSSYIFSPPEYQACFTALKDRRFQARIKINNTEIDMNSFMSYQVGVALKIFLVAQKKGWIIPDVSKYQEADHSMLNPVEINLNHLFKKLTNEEPSKRLSITHFNELLNKIHTNETKFLAELQKLSPKSSKADLNHNATKIVKNKHSDHVTDDETDRNSFIRVETEPSAKEANPNLRSAIEYFQNDQELIAPQIERESSFQITPDVIRSHVVRGDTEDDESTLLDISPVSDSTNKVDNQNNIIYSAAFVLVVVLAIALISLIPIAGPVIVAVIGASFLAAGLGYGLYRNQKGNLSESNDIKLSTREQSSEEVTDSHNNNSYMTATRALEKAPTSSSRVSENKKPLEKKDAFDNKNDSNRNEIKIEEPEEDSSLNRGP